MAIVSHFCVEKATSVKKVLKQSLTERIRQTVGISDDAAWTGTRGSKCKHRDNTVPDDQTGQGATP